MTNSSGYDEVPIKVLKSCKHIIISPLTYIINKSLVTGVFPDGLKCSEIKPIHKHWMLVGLLCGSFERRFAILLMR
jgi:hypothetical protein